MQNRNRVIKPSTFLAVIYGDKHVPRCAKKSMKQVYDDGVYFSAEKQGNHMIFSSTHWKIERILAVSMLGIMPSALFYQGPIMDTIFTTSIFMHAFW